MIPTPYYEGHKSKAICHNCKKIVSTTFKLKDVPFDDGNGVAENILTAVCDACSAVVAIPAQSNISRR